MMDSWLTGKLLPMFKPYTVFIGARYAGAKWRNQLVSFLSVVSILSMTVGVALLILVLSVMNGFDQEMRTKILGLVPHITITANSADKNWDTVERIVTASDGVTASAPFTQLNAMLLRGTEVEGIQVFGIEPSREVAVSIISQYVPMSRLQQLAGDSDSIIIGSALAARLGLEVGSTVNLMVPQENNQGRVTPQFARLQVAAIFHSGTEIDQAVAFMGLQRSLSLMPPDRQFRGLRVSVSDTFAAPEIAWQLAQHIPYGFNVRDWTRTHGNLYTAIQMSKQLVGLMLVTIIAVAAFNLVSALVMIVNDKRGDIAILRAVGASRGGIMKIFIIQGTIIAVFGTVAGCLLGLLLSEVVTDLVAMLESLLGIQFLQSDVYPVDYLPADVRWQDVLSVAATAFCLSVLATLYPSWRAARVEPAEALRYE